MTSFRPLPPPTSFVDDNFVEYEGIVDVHTIDMDMKDHLNVEEEKEKGCGGGVEGHSNHSFDDGNNFHTE